MGALRANEKTTHGGCMCVCHQVLVKDDSPARNYFIEDDDKFYLYATSGIYKGTIGDIQALSTNWIGRCMLPGQMACMQNAHASAFLHA